MYRKRDAPHATPRMMIPFLYGIYAGVIDATNHMQANLDIVGAAMQRRFTTRLFQWIVERVAINTQLVYKAMSERLDMGYDPETFWRQLCKGFECLIWINNHHIQKCPPIKVLTEWYQNGAQTKLDVNSKNQCKRVCLCTPSKAKARLYFCRNCTKLVDGKLDILFLCNKCISKHHPDHCLITAEALSNLEWQRSDIEDNFMV